MLRSFILILMLSLNLQAFAKSKDKKRKPPPPPKQVEEMITGYPQYYCTAANEPFYHRLVNLIGSIHTFNYDSLVEIAVYDLGLTEEMVNNLNKMKRVNVYRLKDNNPDLTNVLTWFAWKPAAIKEALEMFPYVLWIDSGATVLKSLDPLFKYIKHHGYFFCTIGDYFYDNGIPMHSVGWGTTEFVKGKLGLNTPEFSWILDKESLAACNAGFSRDNITAKTFVDEWYGFTCDIRNFAEDGTCPGGRGSARNDQTLLSILAYKKNLKIHVQDWSENIPMVLNLPEGDEAFFMTWAANSVCARTSIYNSRYDTRNFYEYYKHIRFKQE